MVPSTSSSPSTQSSATQAAAVPGNRSLAMSLALVPSLLVAGGLQAQTASTAASPAPEPAKPASPAAAAADKEVVELENLEVHGERTDNKLTSPKFTQPLVNVPQTFSVVPQEVFTKQSATTLSDVLKNTPGVTFMAGEGGNAANADGDNFFMRGFDASGSIFVDGVRNTSQISRDVYNIEQVEIAKGPAGSDIGRTTPGGYVNMATKSPTLEAFQRGSVSYGFDETNADGRARATFDINQPSSDQSGAAVRLNAMIQDGGVTGRETAESHRFGVAPSVSFGLGTPTRVTLAYERFEQHDLPDYGMPVAASPENNYTPAPPSVAQDTFYGTKYDYDDAVSDRGSVKIEHDLSPDTRVSNITVAGRSDRHTDYVTPTSTSGANLAYDPVTGTIRRSHQGNERENENFANLTNLTTVFATGSLEHSLSTGMEFLYENQSTVSYTSVNSDTAFPRTPLLTPDNDIRLDPLVASGATTDNSLKTAALYAFDTIKINESWMLTGGARWEAYKGKYRSTPTTGGTAIDDISNDDDILSWKGGVVYKPRANGSLYTAYGKSVRPPGTNFSANDATTGNNATSADNVLLDPQEADNYEVGTKWEFFQRRLALNLAGFYTENSNVATTDSATGQVVQTNDQIVQGIEFSASGRITENWLVYGGVANMDSEYSAPTSVSTSTADGGTLQWTPEWSGNLWTTYRLPFGLTVGGGAQYMDEVNRLAPTATPPAAGSPPLTQVSDYWLFNALLEYQVTKHFAVRLNVNNVFDEDYIASLNNNGYRYNPGPGRNFVISADFAF